MFGDQLKLSEESPQGFHRAVPPVVLMHVTCVLGCGGTLYGDHGTFTSPNFPGTYPNGSHCEWSITAPRGRLVTVTFAQIYIDDPGSCQNNYLKLYDGPDASSQPVGPYCGAVGILPMGR